MIGPGLVEDEIPNHILETLLEIVAGRAMVVELMVARDSW